MSKQIPILLQSDYDQDATTLCLVLRVLTKGGELYSFTNLDADLIFDPADYDPDGTADDWGSATASASNGFTPERLQMSADLNVDNTDLAGWISTSGITQQQVRAGLFDYAQVRCYRVNYLALDHGHEVVLAGTCGETRYSRVGWITEFRSLTQQTKQTVCLLYSKKCRAKFGSKPIGTGGEQPEERFPCNKDWVWGGPYTVTSVDSTEPDRIFAASSMAESDGFYDLGVVEWLTGDNAGAQMEIDTYTLSVGVMLALPLAYPIQPGDQFRPRQDCDKTLEMCRDTHSNLVNFRGEPYIPTDGGLSMVPGAQV